ncbi:VCBS domain-containing protein [Pseudomonas auratipiscis]|uniref:VCBS domain-containing protein n=1 Tax=Pseudomonas auratipiscis TaxID=3115853 RepID=A0AB35WL80_9PSED|nr:MULTISPECIES: VCBS domain-containing protein [unclassified Pseudomonas]MEE1864922.1 VCBS domain-containing protein [Pseudomonas sp. 120P]MEE1956137.1 VCBS domain-containing protein [Pseudomonas sp. 119P]
MTTRLRTAIPAAFKPQRQALALEPRILFDGAAAAATADQHQQDAGDTGKSDTAHATPSDARSEPGQQASAARHLLVLDSRIEGREQLTANLPDNVDVLVVEANQDGLAAISSALAKLGQVDSIQILSHGAAGEFTLGSTTLTAENVGQYAQPLSQWSQSLSVGADIQLYGCKVGEGKDGRTLVDELARWTGADVGASDDNTGSAKAGGDWNLEISNGLIDKSIALSSAAMSSYERLLAAGPSTGLSGGADVLLGENFTFTVTFSNSTTDAGYAPFIDLFFPATGKDGAGAEIDDGITFSSASYLGQTLTAHLLTFDANGKASHPLAVGTDGKPLIINAADFGMRAGDQMVVLELPFSSVSQGQPPIAIQVTATLSNLADTDFSFSGSTPDLTIRARSGFQYGNDSLNNPATDPSILEPSANADSYVVHPTVITVDQTVSTPEGETATGPNFVRTLSGTITPADSQTLTNVVISQPVPDNVIVKGITPAAGGTVVSITLYDGRVITDPALIRVTLARNNDSNLGNDVYLREFSVRYPTISGPTTTSVQFFVPDDDADGVPVLNPVTGNDVAIVFDGPTATGDWVPLDPRDAAGGQIEFSGTGQDVSFIAKSITLQKEVTVAIDGGTAGVSPGDTLSYRLNIALSDYFAFGKTFLGNGSFVVADSLGDGQTLVPGTATLTLTVNGITQTITLISSAVVNADGTTSMQFDVAGSISNAFAVRNWLNGDLAFDDVLQGATLAVISYQARIGQSYTPPSGNPHPEINEGDPLGNNATVTATVLLDPLNLSGDNQSDSSTTTTTIPTSQVEINLADRNGGGAPAPGTELRPGDRVTFRISYDLITGDYENFKLTAYLPLPLFDLSGLDLNTIWRLATDNTNPNTPTSVTLGPGNSLVFTFADYVNSGVEGSRISIDFTLTVSDQPFADQRAFNVLGESSQTRTLDKSALVTTDDVALIASIAEPVLNISHGVVSSSHGTVSGTTGSWTLPGTAGTPFAGSITDISAVNGNVSGIDASDRLRLATAIENSGGGSAFDVRTSITLPPGLSFVGGSLSAANLQIYRGDGTRLIAGTHFTVNNATNTITFIDGAGVGGLLAGRPGSAADSSGANVVVITYEVNVSATIAASSTLQTSAQLLGYASVEGGQNFVGSTPLSDIAGQQVAAPTISKNYAGGSLDNSDSSATHTTGSNLVVGESMLYDIVVTLPEGTTQNLRIDDLIPPGMRLDTSFEGRGYLVITSAGGLLAQNFAGTVTIGSLSAPSGTLGADGADARFVFTVSSATGDNNTGNNSFVIRLRLVASNVIANQTSAVRQNDATLNYRDPDGDTPNGATAVSRDVAVTGAKPTITIQEPTLQLNQQLVTPPGLGFDQGDKVEYNITLSNGTASSDNNAFDINFSSELPTELDGLTLISAIYTVNGVSTDITGSFTLDPTGRTLINTGNVDIAKGGTVVLRVSGVVNATGASVAQFDNLAQVRWTSLDGTVAGERTGNDGTLNSGVLNDYRRDSVLIIPVAQGIKFSRVGGLTDTAAPNPTNALEEKVAVGEVIRYRATVLVPEGNNPNYQLVITLGRGLTLGDLSTLRIGFVSDGGLVTSLNDLITSGTLQILGNEDSPEAQYITPDLSGAAPTGVLNPIYVQLGTDANGNQIVTLNLGNITNGAHGGGDDGNDDDLEGIVVEFNARVSNIVENQSGVALDAIVQDRVNGNLRATSDVLRERIVESSFSEFNKQVTDFTPNPAGTTGNATVTVNFTASGGLPAYDVHLSDGFPTGSNYNLISVTIGGTLYGPGNLPAGVTFSTTGGLSVDIARIDIGTRVSVVYSVDVPNGTTIANTDANLSWSSLPETFTSWGGTTVGADGSASGERNGTDGPGADATTLNNYVLREGAGLGIISGTLWNDTGTAASSPNDVAPDADPVPGTPAYELAIANQTIKLIWAGVDGVLGNGDDKTFSTTTDSNGRFIFGVLPSGLYRVDAPTTVNSISQFGELRIRIDTDGSTLGQVRVTLGEGSAQQANSGYVEVNDAPVNTLPGSQSGNEDAPLAIPGISVSDVDAERNPNVNGRAIQVTLTVTHGTLSLTGAATGVTVSGTGTTALVLLGRIADINAALASLSYLGNLNFNGVDSLQVQTTDLGNYGDFDGNGIPGQPTDARTDTDLLVINLDPVNDAPIANPDTATAVEAGGTNNQLDGIDPRGNVLDNDTDVDIATNGDVLNVISVTSPLGVTLALTDIGAIEIAGRYGKLVLSAHGAYEYIVDNNNAQVQALRLAGDQLTEVFSYTIADIGLGGPPLQSTSSLTVVIQGTNDAPVGNADSATAIEKGGGGNTDVGKPNDTPPSNFPIPGTDASGNVLDNDNDVDGGEKPTDPIDYGETIRVSGIRATPEISPAPLTTVPANGSVSLAGTYGTLTIASDGTYSYVIDNSNTAVQRLGPNDSLTEVFSYQVTDALGLNDLAELRITVKGNFDNPLASDDAAQAQAGSDSTNESNPSGNVIQFPSRPGNTGPGGTGIDADVDAADRPNTVLQVNGIRSGIEAVNGIEPSNGALTPVTSGPVSIAAVYARDSTGVPIAVVAGDNFGMLTINPNGSFTFDVNSNNAAIIALPRGVSMEVVFTYQVVDSAGLTDTAQLVIVVTGANNPPHAQDTVVLATEAGGAGNGTPGLDPGVPPAPIRQVTFADPDGDPISVTGIRTGLQSATDGTVGVVGDPLNGKFGTLTIQPDGTYTYVIDNNNSEVQALRGIDDLLVEVFTYRVTDSDGEFDDAQIVIVIRGQNDNPVAGNDSATAVEAGGVNNSSGGVDPTGNVLTNDNDVDGGVGDPTDYGETSSVASVRTGATEGAGNAGTLGSELRGTYGWLTLNADGSYSYRLDNSMAAVQALRPGNTLTDAFNYHVIDTAGATDIAVLNITIQGSNDAPVANPDSALAVEAGGLNNATPGSNPSGNVLSNDTDVDQFGEKLTVTAIRQGPNAGSVGSSFAGQYGSLTLNADGSYTYLVDNNNPQVQALRTAGDTVSEFFTYTIRDLSGALSAANLTITIRGQNDNPLAVNDTAIAVEAGGTNNGTAGLNPTANLLSNDTDVDAGDSKTVNGIRAGSEAAGGTFTAVTGPQTVSGIYGTLTVFANGDYRYQVNNALAAVQALKPGDTLQEVFTYRMRDTAGAEDIAQFSLTIQGAWDAPVARDNVNLAVADNGDGLTINPSGNVLPNDSDVDQGDVLTVTGIRTGPESGTGVAGTVGNVLIGQYGTLVINADGSYTYHVDSSNPAVLALDLLQTVVDKFTYQVTDRGGLTDLAQLSIIVIGRNDVPDGIDDAATAVEAGGLNNATPGFNPSGNVLSNDIDLENDVLTVSAIRTGSETGTGTDGTVGTTLRGLYGDLVMNADGSWTYTVDNSLAAVQALRTSGQVLVDVFTYTVVDPHQADDTAQLTITIDGRNDTPIAVDDNSIAVEAGGVSNAKPGVDPRGNVLDNDTDVDSSALGETRQVLSVTSETGNTALAGQTIAGRYGHLLLNADGSYQYVLDNNNPTVQALRTAGETLREVFTYRMRDTAGAESQARLNILIQGANDSPLARDDSNVASDQTTAPQSSGNVLPNDSDVDGGDQLSVSAIRTGAETGTGTHGVLGQPLAGRYGTLVINADGSYTYTIDMSNPQVLAAAGLGQVLQDVFTYTLVDRAGATDLAQLTISLDITAPFIPAPAGPFFGRDAVDPLHNLPLPDVQPAVFVGPVVEAQSRALELSSWQADGSNLSYGLIPEIRSETLNQRLGLEQGQFVAKAVHNSSRESSLDMAWILGRQSRINLSADGLLPDPSVFATDAAHMNKGDAQLPPPSEARIASGFRAQLREAAERLRAMDNGTRE